MPTVGGADGCRQGWVLVVKELDAESAAPPGSADVASVLGPRSADVPSAWGGHPARRFSGSISWRTCTSTKDLFYGPEALDLLGLDMPIGLPDSGPRLCDLEARRRLGFPRGSSVFPAPIRSLLHARSYLEACALSFEADRKKISRQTWAILPKIRDVDSLLRDDPELQDRVREVHPEVCFSILAGRPMEYRKKRKQGQEERVRLLETVFGAACLHAALSDRRALGCPLDDLLDAFVACWTAERIYRGREVTLPAAPPRDSAGLRMEILG